ncbi:DUF2569 family protein [Sphingomonas bacterium]|uniref:DUF2569 family protein n=1 Tax=Sphingomonas bacterium TaxID=1895847 RepID=UPI00157526CB|nr:DUF2569 family protein [Sphingomonas bacterium]
MGGWLVFLFGLLSTHAALRLLVLIYPFLYPDDWDGEELVAFAIISAALAWLLLFRREPSTPLIVIAGLWLMALEAPAMTVLSALHVQATGPFAFAEAARTALDWDFFKPVLHSAFWTAYLLRSKRVANTYFRVHEPRLADVFG